VQQIILKIAVDETFQSQPVAGPVKGQFLDQELISYHYSILIVFLLFLLGRPFEKSLMLCHLFCV